ncbi:hypothetical protein G8F28_004228 [Salmonella enterica]|nr:hypothetical protein [Salmonella enterica]
MPEDIPDVRAAGITAVSYTNKYFQQTHVPLYAETMSREDLAHCIRRSGMSDHPLEWRNVEQELENEDSYNFCFKLTTVDEEHPDWVGRPQGGCACSWNDFTRIVSIDMIQNFDIEDGPLDGRMMVFSLISLMFFLESVAGTGVHINQPVNAQVRDYYINELGFSDISGDGSLLYRSYEDLMGWLRLMDQEDIAVPVAEEETE